MEGRRLLVSNRLPSDKRKSALDLLGQGKSLREIERATGIHRDTIMRLSEKLDLVSIITDDRAHHLFIDGGVGFWGLFRLKSFCNLTPALMALNIPTLQERDSHCMERNVIFNLCGIHCLV